LTEHRPHKARPRRGGSCLATTRESTRDLRLSSRPGGHARR
jgi:hypothetical protein